MRFVLAVLATCAGCDSTSVTLDAPPPDDLNAPDAPACACALGQPTAAGAVANGALELSGLATSRAIAGLVWTHNDSNGGPTIFAIGDDGSTRGSLVLQATATDWEDLAIAPCGDHGCLYVGDIGDNQLARASVRIYEVDEPAQIAGSVAATFRAFDIAYPDGPHNAEALFVDPRDGAAYIITKQAANPSQVFRMPRTTGAIATAELIGSIVIPSGTPLVTAADLYADDCGVRVLVRTYGALFELRGGPSTTIAALLASPLVAVPVATEPQGEAVAFRPDGRGYLTVSESATPMLSSVACE